MTAGPQHFCGIHDEIKLYILPARRQINGEHTGTFSSLKTGVGLELKRAYWTYVYSQSCRQAVS